MKVLLVYPKYPNTFWSFDYALKFVSKKASMPPLGLLTVASLLPHDWNKKLVDCNVRALEDREILWADLVFISAMIVQKTHAQEIIKRCKYFNKTVVAGGPVFTTQSENFSGADHFVLNEAEATLPKFLDDFINGKAKRIYRSKQRPDITKTPLPDWSLINLKNYATMAVQYSRGCPHNCEFCDIVIMNGRIPRIKTPGQIIKELEALYKAGWRESIFFVDDNFIGNKLHVKKMLAHLILWQKRHKFPFRFLTEATADLAKDERLMRMMSAANFCKVFLGIETPDIDSLKECGKYHNTNLNLAEAVKTIQAHGMQVMGGFIVGFDNDKTTIFDRQIRFIQQVGIVTAMVGLLNATPQTRLWHRLKAEGRLLKETTGENTDGSLNFIPKMDTEKLIEGYKKILRTIYSSTDYYKRINIFIRNYKPTAISKINRADFFAFIKSLWKIGVLSKSRFRYWWLLFKTAATKAKALPIAIELAIYGQHFEKVTKRILSV
ncbi:DUF4070 domain-containing protein [Candidatus Woesearchaeota archaeon]|nr:DUF4070 domain-containing protein [Candidatus Woesearchaeota archaeon]